MRGTTPTVRPPAWWAARATHSISPWFTPPNTMVWPSAAAHRPSSSVSVKKSGSICELAEQKMHSFIV